MEQINWNHKRYPYALSLLSPRWDFDAGVFSQHRRRDQAMAHLRRLVKAGKVKTLDILLKYKRGNEEIVWVPTRIEGVVARKC